MDPFSLPYKSSIIGYRRIGSGSQIVFCFHGYGEESMSYCFLERYLGADFTLYSIDLPFHGTTQWNEGLLFTHHDLQQVIDAILNGHAHPKNAKYFLAGYSLGGRIALSHYQSHSARVAKLILLAPDGLKVNSWYWLATQTYVGNRFFAFTMKKPPWFFGLLKLMNKCGFVNSSIFKFVKYYIDNPEVRRLLYARWTTLRKLKPNLKRIKKFILENKTPVTLVYGKHDRIILPSVGEKFKKGIEEHCEIVVIESGHQVLHEKHVGQLLPAFYEVSDR